MRRREPVGGVTLWDWARSVYARPGVEALCLALQDRHGQCVAYLIWAAWAARTGRAVGAARVAEAASLARGWDVQVIAPLRGIRRALKQPVAGVEPQGQAALRTRIKAEELAAEQLLLEALEALTPASAGAAALDPVVALSAASAAWGAPAPDDLLEALSSAFSIA